MTAKHEDKIFDSAPDTDLYKGAHVRQYTSKLRKTATGPSGEILYFVEVKNHPTKSPRWRAFVAWRPEDAEHYDQFVDVGLLRLENTSPPPRKTPAEIVDSALEKAGEAMAQNASAIADALTCDCGGELRFDPDLVGDTCGGLTRIGWDVCVKCGKGWLSSNGTSHESWRLAGGGRSVETGVGRIRVDGAKDAEKLMARIAKLPELELEVAQLRKALAKEEPIPTTPHGETSPWAECKLVVNGIDLRDGDRILKINQPEAKDNGAFVIRLEKS